VPGRRGSSSSCPCCWQGCALAFMRHDRRGLAGTALAGARNNGRLYPWWDGAGAGARAHPFLRHRDARSDARWPRCRQDRRRDDRAPRRSRRIGGHGDARDRCHDADRRVAPRRSHPSRARLWCCRSPASRVSSSKRFLAGGQPKGLRLAWRTCGPWARYSGLRANEAAPQSSFAWYKPANEATKLFAWTGRPTRKPCAPSQSAERRNLS